MIYFWINFWAFCIKQKQNQKLQKPPIKMKAAANNWFLMPVILGSKNDIQHMLARKGWHRSTFDFSHHSFYFLKQFWLYIFLLFNLSKRDFKTQHVKLYFLCILKRKHDIFINSILLWLIIIVTVLLRKYSGISVNIILQGVLTNSGQKKKSLQIAKLYEKNSIQISLQFGEFKF